MADFYEIEVSAQAEADMREVYSWIAEVDSDFADQWYSGVVSQMETLSTLPHRCPLAPESRMRLLHMETRQLLYGKGYWKYRILFQVAGNTVWISHVRHGARLYLGQEDDV